MFRNRGSVPNIEIGKNGKDNDNNGYNVPHYSNYWNGNFIIIRYDKNLLIMEIIAFLIVLITVFGVYIFAYKTSFEDPLETIKKGFLNTQLVAIILSIISTGVISFFTKSSKENLIRNLRVIGIISIAIITMFLIVKLNLDKKYNQETFSKFYQQYEQNDDDDEIKNQVSVGLSGIKLTTKKQAYIEESTRAYTNFSIKTMLYIIIHIALVILIFYISNRLSAIETKKQKLAKDDAILYDEEENIKF